MLRVSILATARLVRLYLAEEYELCLDGLQSFTSESALRVALDHVHVLLELKVEQCIKSTRFKVRDPNLVIDRGCVMVSSYRPLDSVRYGEASSPITLESVG